MLVPKLGQGLGRKTNIERCNVGSRLGLGAWWESQHWRDQIRDNDKDKLGDFLLDVRHWNDRLIVGISLGARKAEVNLVW